MIALSEVYDLDLWSKKIEPEKLDKLGKALYDENRNKRTQYVIGILKNGLWYPVGTTDEKNIFIPGYWDKELSYDFPWVNGNDFFTRRQIGYRCSINNLIVYCSNNIINFITKAKE